MSWICSPFNGEYYLQLLFCQAMSSLNLERGLNVSLHNLLLGFINYVFYSSNTEHAIHMSIEKPCVYAG